MTEEAAQRVIELSEDISSKLDGLEKNHSPINSRTGMTEWNGAPLHTKEIVFDRSETKSKPRLSLSRN